MILCPNTSPLLVLARIGRLDLLGQPSSVVLTRAVVAEVAEKSDLASRRVEELASSCRLIADPQVPSIVDPSRDLGPGERSVLAWGLLAASELPTCVLDDAAARAEARRLSLRFTGTLGLVLRAKKEGRVDDAASLLERAVSAGLFLSGEVLRRALERTGETWPR